MMPDDTIEEWRPIERLDGYYEVSNLGRVQRATAAKGARVGRILKPTLTHYGYFAVALSATSRRTNDRPRPALVHRLVAETFLGPPPSPRHTQVNHMDGIKTNNRVANLEWVTPAENVRHAYRLGLTPAPTPRCKLTERKVRAIRRVSREFTNAEIADVLGVSETTVSNARAGRSWRHTA